MSSTIPFIAVVITGVIASGAFLILPIMVGGIADQYGWGDREVGWLAAADMGGSALASLVMAAFIARVNWKITTRIAIALSILGNLASINMDNLSLLLLVRVFTGLCNGVVLSVVFAALCRSTHPDRYFGVYVFTQLGSQAVLLPLLPRFIEAGGMTVIFAMLASASLASLFLVQLFPGQSLLQKGDRVSTSATSRDSEGGPRFRGFLALLAQALYFLAPAAIWGYFESIGESFGLAIGAVGDALGLAAFAGIAGGVAVVVLGNRFDRMKSMAAGTAVSLLAVWILMTGSGFFWFLLAAVFMNFSWNYTFPYQMGTLALFDRDGSIAVLSLLVQTFGLSFGPLMASFLLAGGDFSLILVSCIGCYLSSLLLFWFSSRREAGMNPELA